MHSAILISSSESEVHLLFFYIKVENIVGVVLENNEQFTQLVSVNKIIKSYNTTWI